jgi:hypothetical protein
MDAARAHPSLTFIEAPGASRALRRPQPHSVETAPVRFADRRTQQFRRNPPAVALWPYEQLPQIDRAWRRWLWVFYRGKRQGHMTDDLFGIERHQTPHVRAGECTGQPTHSRCAENRWRPM